MDRIKKLSMEILENHKDEFGINFGDNKEALEKVSIIRSKSLKNEIAGFITRFHKHEILDKKKQEEKISKQAKLDEETPGENFDSQDSKSEPSPETPFSEEKPQETSE